MAYDKVIDSSVLDGNLLSIANAIREKAELTENFAFPQGFIDAISGIAGGSTIKGEPLMIGSFTLAEDFSGSSTRVVPGTQGLFETNTAYTLFVCSFDDSSSIYELVGKKGVILGFSKRSNNSNNNNDYGVMGTDNYGSTKLSLDKGWQKTYKEDCLSYVGGTDTIIKGGIEYTWIAIKDGV